MDTNKIKDWKENLKKLPASRKGLASALCDAVLVSFAIASYLIAKAVGYKLGINWLIGFLFGAKLLATILFFAWVQSAINLEKKTSQKTLRKP